MNFKKFSVFVFAVTAFYVATSLISNAQVPRFTWAKSAGGSSFDGGNSIAVDLFGNSYVAGSFRDTAHFGNMSIKSSGENDIFIAKLDSLGNYIWVLGAGGSSYDDPRNLTLDKHGNVYVTGHYSNNITFGNTTLTESTSGNVFIVKINSLGNIIWAKAPIGNRATITDIEIDNFENLYISGAFLGSITIGNNTLSSTFQEALVVKLDSAGDFLWSRRSYGIANSLASATSIAIDRSGDCIIHGGYIGSINFGASSGMGVFGNSGTNGNSFMIKYSPTGIMQWSKEFSGPREKTAQDVACDGANNIYISGTFAGTVTFDNTSNLTAVGSRDIYLLKLDALGNLIWMNQIGGSGFTSGGKIAVEGSGYSCVLGSYLGTTMAGTHSVSSSGSYDALAARFSPTGSALWLSSSGSANQEQGSDIAMDSSGQCYLIGQYFTNSIFGSDTLVSQGENDVFIAKVREQFITKIEKSALPQLVVYPNPIKDDLYLKFPEAVPADITFFNMLGREVLRQHIPYLAGIQNGAVIQTATLQPGMYFLQVQQGKSTHQLHIIK